MWKIAYLKTIIYNRIYLYIYMCVCAKVYKDIVHLVLWFELLKSEDESIGDHPFRKPFANAWDAPGPA